jgi:2-succinyl-6-hydroxy-2,4-cyclohexadiene-1-carboxylate synthase
MILNIKNVSLNVIYNENELERKIPVLFLHGYTGCTHDWEFLYNKLPSNFTPIFIDLIGHGKSSSSNNISEYSSDFQIDLLYNLLQKLSLRKIIFVGYSMGGRLALSFAMKYPEKVVALVLESTSFGIEKQTERDERIKADKQLADQIENSTISEFIEFWMNIPLFDSLNIVASSKLDQLKLRKINSNNSIGLKNSLLGFTTGKMKNFLPYLNEFQTKVLLISGELDVKFSLITKNAHSIFPKSELKIVEECGHNVHFEKPEEFLKLLNVFLLNIRDN